MSRNGLLLDCVTTQDDLLLHARSIARRGVGLRRSFLGSVGTCKSGFSIMAAWVSRFTSTSIPNWDRPSPRRPGP